MPACHQNLVPSRLRFLLVAGATLAGLGTITAHGQPFPVCLVVPYPPDGGNTIVDPELVAKAAPDGYTRLLGDKA